MKHCEAWYLTDENKSLQIGQEKHEVLKLTIDSLDLRRALDNGDIHMEHYAPY